MCRMICPCTPIRIAVIALLAVGWITALAESGVEPAYAETDETTRPSNSSSIFTRPATELLGEAQKLNAEIVSLYNAQSHPLMSGSGG
jgi:hypothetical protein